jgi:hypothetical protein
VRKWRFRVTANKGTFDDIAPVSMPPPPWLAFQRLNRVLRRRLSDRVFDVFQEACIAGDLDTAETLLALLEQMQRQRQAAFPERRLDTEVLGAARDELATRKAERQTRLAPTTP